jgi:hypothetical protein
VAGFWRFKLTERILMEAMAVENESEARHVRFADVMLCAYFRVTDMARHLEENGVGMVL